MSKHVIDALSDGFKDAGCQSVYNFPGFYSHNLFEQLGGKTISLNERVAYAEAFGSSLAGKRTVVTFKNVGLNIASDAYLHSIISGVNAGMVLVIFDDIDVQSSQESQDSRHYFNINGGLWLEPTSMQEAYNMAYESFLLSESLDIPVVIRISNPILGITDSYSKNYHLENKQTQVEVLDSSTNRKYIVHPCNFNEQRERLFIKQSAIQKYVDNSYKYTKIEPGLKSAKAEVVFGCSSLLKKESDCQNTFSINTLPIPSKLYVDLKKYTSVNVFEYGDSVAHDIIASHLSPKIASYIPVPHPKQQDFLKWKKYEELFNVIAETKPNCVIGDVTQFTVETSNTINACLSLGVAVSTSIGYSAASDKSLVYAVSGDCSFLHEGIGILQEALKRKVNINVIIVDNSGSWCTGGQPNTGDLDLFHSMGLDYINSVDIIDNDFTVISDCLKHMMKIRGTKVLHLKVPLGSFERK